MRRVESISALLLRLALLAVVLLPLPGGGVLAAPGAPPAPVTKPGTDPAGEPATAGTIVTAPAATSTLTLAVVAARTEPLANGGAGVTEGDPVTAYKFLINVDNTGDSLQDRYAGCHPFLDPPTNSVRDPNYPDACDWPSIREMPGAAPVWTSGDETVLDGTTGLNLPDGKYLISVVADGYKIGGAHFTVPLADPGLVTVALQPHPLPAVIDAHQGV